MTRNKYVHPYCWLSGEPIDPKNASEGIQFAYGLFETVRVDNGRPEQLEAHLDRLNMGLERIGLNYTLTQAMLYVGFNRLMHHVTLKSGVLKIVALRRGADLALAEVDVQLYLRVNPYRNLLINDEKPYLLKVSTFTKNSRSPMAGLKWVGYADHVIERERAIKDGFQDVLFLNENDQIAETSTANLFWLKEGVLFTPALECGILPGVMRLNVINAAKTLELSVHEGRFSLQDLREADCVFVTNSLMRLLKVTGVGDVYFTEKSAESSEIFMRLYSKVISELM